MTEMNQSTKYAFQESYKSIYTENLGGYSAFAEKEYKNLVIRLGIPKNLESNIESYLRKFVNENLMNISWYSEKIEKEKKIQSRYLRGNIFLLLSIPIVIFTLTLNPVFPEETSIEGAKYVTSMLTLILTIAFGINKLVNSWYEKRNFIGQFHGALIDLKNIVYELEDDWIEKVVLKDDKGTETINPEFTIALLEQTEASRKIVQDETKAYFQKLSKPKTIDLSSILISSKESASKVFEVLKSSNFDIKGAEDKLKSQTEKTINGEKILKVIKNKEAVLKEIEEKMKVKESELSKLDPKEDLERSRSIKSSLKSLQSHFDKIELEIIELKVKANS